jgi:hypothetical protein
MTVEKITVSDELVSWLGNQQLKTWLAEFQDEQGAFTEAELVAIALEKGVDYVPPRQKG